MRRRRFLTVGAAGAAGAAGAVTGAWALAGCDPVDDTGGRTTAPASAPPRSPDPGGRKQAGFEDNKHNGPLSAAGPRRRQARARS
ncbi:hypothetical protein ACFV6W_28160, partial [Streptomyces sp. NPDC059802]